MRKAGLKLTHQRLEIIKEISRTKEHPDVETIYKRVSRRVPTVSLDTVYRTLTLLEKEKLISRVEVLSDRVRYDPDTDRHHHFICNKCGIIHDVYNQTLYDLAFSEYDLKLGCVQSIHVLLRGLCAECAE